VPFEFAPQRAIRNAARYGCAEKSDRALNLRVEVKSKNGTVIVIEDDGVGVQTKQSEQGSGQGLALHSAMLAVVGGTLAVEPRAEGGTRVTMRQKDDNGQDRIKRTLGHGFVCSIRCCPLFSLRVRGVVGVCVFGGVRPSSLRY
jgi:hypothetical protein